MKLILITIILVGLAVLGIGIKVLFGRVFSGTCASQSPELNPEGKPCSFCGKTPEEQAVSCKRYIRRMEKQKRELEKKQRDQIKS